MIVFPEEVIKAAQGIHEAIDQHYADYANERWAEFREEHGLSEEEILLLRAHRTNEVDQIELFDLDLTIRAYNCLWRNGIRTVRALVECTPWDLFDIRNFGYKSYLSVQAGLDKYGLKLKEDDGSWGSSEEAT